MKFGDEEWLKKLNDNYSFPCKIAFILIKDMEGGVSIMSTLVKTKAKLENIKYSNISKSTWTSRGSAVLSVKECANALDYLKESEHLKDIWGFALRKGEANEL